MATEHPLNYLSTEQASQDDLAMLQGLANLLSSSSHAPPSTHEFGLLPLGLPPLPPYTAAPSMLPIPVMDPSFNMDGGAQFLQEHRHSSLMPLAVSGAAQSTNPASQLRMDNNMASTGKSKGKGGHKPPKGQPKPALKSSARPLATVPSVVESMDCDSDEGTSPINIQHWCPIAGCVKHEKSRSGGGLGSARALVDHVDRVHVAGGVIPPKRWMEAWKVWVCGNCMRLNKASRPRCTSDDCRPVIAKEQASRVSQSLPLPPVQQPSGSSGGTPLNQPCPPLAPTFRDLQGEHVPLFRHIPKGARYQWGSMFTRLLADALRHNTWEAWHAFWVFPKVTLACDVRRGGSAHQKAFARGVLKRMEMFDDGKVSELWDESTRRASLRPRPPKKQKGPLPLTLADKRKRLEDESFLASLNGLLDEGAFSKAAKHLISDGLQNASDDKVLDKLRTLHPQGARLVTPQNLPSPDWDGSEEGRRDRLELIRKVILGFPVGSAPGPSGLRPSHLQDLVRRSSPGADRLLGVLDEFIYHAIQGDLSTKVLQWLGAARLIPLRKKDPDPTAVRPVAVGETLRRMVGKFLLADSCTLDTIRGLLPLQCGVRTPNACEMVAMGLQSLLDNDLLRENEVILQVDLRNAFNCLDRHHMLHEVSTRAPHLARWVHATYAEPTPLILGDTTIMSSQGVQQGDPLGPLLFAIGWQSVIEKMPQARWNVWYLDDGIVVCSAEEAHTLFSGLEQAAKDVGMEINAAKCRLFGPGADSISSGAPPESLLKNVPVVPFKRGQGLVVLGQPVEHPAGNSYRESYLKERRQQIEDLCGLLGYIGNTQQAYYLMRYCADACKLNHLLRGCNTFHLKMELAFVSDCLREALGSLIGASLPDHAWFQAGLPVRLGGLGIRDPLRVVMAARISAIVGFIEDGDSVGVPNEALRAPPDFLPRATEATNWLGDGWDPLASWISSGRPSCDDGDFKRQKWWDEKIASQMRQWLGELGSLRDQARLRLLRAPGSHCWLSPAPGDGMGTKFPSVDYKALLRWWLGRPLLPQEASGLPCPQCAEPMDIFGDHLVCCQKSGLTERHTILRDALASILRERGAEVRTEVALPDGSVPADVLIPRFDAAGALAIDTTVVHPLAPGRSRMPSTTCQVLAAKESEKERHYKQACAVAHWSFSPLAAHPWGGWGPKSSTLLNRMIKFMVGEKEGGDRAIDVCRIRHTLGAAILRGVAQQLATVHDVGLSFCPPLEAHEGAGLDEDEEDEYICRPILGPADEDDNMNEDEVNGSGPNPNVTEATSLAE